MSALALTEAQWMERMRQERSVKDKSYQLYPLGMEVARFLRAKRIEGCARATQESYETTLRLLTLDHRDFASLESFCEPGGVDLLNDFLANRWGDSEESTLDQRTGALNSFLIWAYETGRMSRSLRVKRRRRGDRKLRVAHPLETISEIAAAQETLRDQIFVLLMGRLGLRKMEVGSLRVKDIDLTADVVRLRKTKGGGPAEVPIAFKDLRDLLYLWMQEAERHPDSYIFHPRGHPERLPNKATVHRRFARCLENAGVEHFPMHELRHSAADRLWRLSGDAVAAKELLRHSKLDTTMGYLHPTGEDLRARMKEIE